MQRFPQITRPANVSRRDIVLMGAGLSIALCGVAKGEDEVAAFRDKAISILRHHFPGRQFEKGLRDDEIISPGHQLFVDNICKQTEAMGAPERETAIIEWFAAMDRAHEQIENILRDFQQVRPLLRPRLLPARALGLNTLVSRPFVADLVRICVIDLPNAAIYVSEARRRDWAVKADTLHDVALSNLDRGSASLPLVSESGQNGAPDVLYVDGHDSYDAARILLPSIRDRITTLLGGEAIVAIPTRDAFIAWPKGSPRQKEFTDKVATMIVSSAHPLCQRLLCLAGGEVRAAQVADLRSVR